MKKLNKKTLLLLALVLIVLVGTVSGTVAWITTNTNPVINMFSPAEVKVVVTDDVDGKTKSNVTIKNTGDTDAYIRAAIAACWYKDGKIVAAWDESQGTFSNLPGTDWTKGADGYYYYTKSVAPNDATGSKLFDSYTAPDAPVDGAHLEMDIIVQAIQSSPAAAISDAGWAWQPSAK